jgi:hypothetical protein
MIETVLVKAQNVHNYFVEHHKEHGWEDLATFVCVKPPFKRMRVTYDHCFNALYDKDRNHIPAGPIWRYAEVEIYEETVEEFSYYLHADTDPRYRAYSDEIAELRAFVETTKPASILRMRLVFDDLQLPGRWFVFIDATGRVLVYHPYGWVFINSAEEQEYITRQRIPMEDLQNTFCKHGAIALATLSFMNCKNVEVIDNPPSRQQRRAAEREHKPIPVSYKTLCIHPFGKPRHVMRHANGEVIPGVSLHICRGHFKDFREGPGLGKFHSHGIWWWSPQVRGTQERGRVVKDYAVDLPV